ncbi:hypothetical protein Q31b_06410 [Novipirellula aureliae]|uniref:Thioredoxin-like fold domain-containing protein n=1 Tax=Novipirellula aureliae TaxID=2527966 RepID=A0A5C6EE22_9BACT|nr:thioredoxin domain-containing protein [Novipirellula aureliae]TWU45469.1 hypothetical protein Q31b_06410 [Novipirellula aureliae]
MITSKWPRTDFRNFGLCIAALCFLLGPANVMFAEDNAAQKSPRKAVVLSNVKLDTSAWPMIGNPDAEKVFVELFDYTCSHCRETHQSIKGAKMTYGDRLAVLSLPVPMDGKCNPTVSSTRAASSEACDLAKLSIAVWAVDRAAFSGFHDFLFESRPTYNQALQRAFTIVDRDELNAMLASSIPTEFINKHVQLYQRAGSGTIPKLMFPRTTIVGAVHSTNELNSLIERHCF